MKSKKHPELLIFLSPSLRKNYRVRTHIISSHIKCETEEKDDNDNDGDDDIHDELMTLEQYEII